MKRVVHIIPLTLVIALCGCAVTLHGGQSASSGAVRTNTASSVSVSSGSANARMSGSFGAAPSAGASGGQLSVPRGGSLLVLLGVVIADAFTRSGDAAGKPAAPGERISDTCSCYGWTPAPNAATINVK